MDSNNMTIECPIDKATNIFSKKQTIQIIRDLFFGKIHFKEFQEDKPKLSNKILSKRLKGIRIIFFGGFPEKSANTAFAFLRVNTSNSGLSPL